MIVITVSFCILLIFIKDPVIVNYCVCFYSFAYFYLFIRLLHGKDKYDIERLVAVCKDEYVFDENPDLLKNAREKISLEKRDLFSLSMKILVIIPYIIPCFFATSIIVLVVYSIPLVIFLFLTRHFIYPKITEMCKISKLDKILTTARMKEDDD